MAIRGWSETSSGLSASVQMAATGGRGGGLRLTRAFKILLEHPSDINNVDIPSTVGIALGDSHPLYDFCVCDSLDLKPQGEGGLVWLLSANYTTSDVSLLDPPAPGSNQPETPDPREQEPETRYANWSVSTTTIETPAWVWKADTGDGNGDIWRVAANPVGDRYDGLSMLQPIVNITVEQFVRLSPASYSQYVGQVNSNQGLFAGFNLFPHSVLFRGVNQRPHTERRRNGTWRGWMATFEFSYKPNYNGYLNQYIGWDIAVPITGLNCRNAGLRNQNVEQGALTLALTDDRLGIIAGWEDNTFRLQPGTLNKKVRANVLIATDGAKASQRPSAQPVPLNLDGTPRASDLAQPVLIQRACAYKEFDMSLLDLRFRN